MLYMFATCLINFSIVVADVVVVAVAVAAAGVAVALVCRFKKTSNAAGFQYMRDVDARSVKTRHACISSCVPSSFAEARCFEVAMVVPWIDAFYTPLWCVQ